MQFREAKGRIQVLAYAGYDKEKRRSVVQLLGSMDKYDLKPTDTLLERMTDEQKKELQSYIEKERQLRAEASKRRAARYLHSQIKTVADSLTTGVYEPDADWTAELYQAIDELTTKMRKAGFKRPKKPAKAKKAAPPDHPDFFSSHSAPSIPRARKVTATPRRKKPATAAKK